MGQRKKDNVKGKLAEKQGRKATSLKRNARMVGLPKRLINRGTRCCGFYFTEKQRRVV